MYQKKCEVNNTSLNAPDQFGKKKKKKYDLTIKGWEGRELFPA